MSRGRHPVGVLVSGRGSNLQALLDAAANPHCPFRIDLVISNVPGAAALERAARAGVATEVIDHRRFAHRPAFESVVDDALRAAGVETVCLAGFMRVLTGAFTEAWRDRALNIHPSLLPSFKGLDTHARALAAGVKLAGCSIHLVRPETDAGPILAQAAVPVLPGDTPGTLAERVLAQEHRLYPATLAAWVTGGFRLDGDVALPVGPVAVDPASALRCPG